ncbi:S8 family peptidase [Arenicella xantha]|uniref:Subtilase family protein n=1 Tax=Arenicella xantha TaxID=644221 RepID=A0A395JPJ1_9GAMM|nr:S8 family serine peptidase [Arenicella xantha]RBP50620.1 subtilase family protein [Arenicella xantha]
MNIYSKVLLAIVVGISSVSINAQPQTSEWVVVLNDPRPERLKGWQRDQYSGDGHYRNALELKRASRRVADKHDLAIRAEWFIESLGVYCLVAAINGDQALTLDRLRSDANVKSVQASNSFELLRAEILPVVELASIDAKLSSNLTKLLAPPELQLPPSIDGRRVAIALVDSAVDDTHPEISKQVIKNLDFVDDENYPATTDVHGTAVAGVIVADQTSDIGVTGVAPGASLSAYRGCWERAESHTGARDATNCNTLTLARALDAVAMSNEADILNLSLSGPKDELLDQLVKQIVSQGTIVVIAFDPTRLATDRFPSVSTGVVTVRADSLNQDQTEIFSAPGEKIVAAPRKRANFMQGHSVAAAYTSGILALCIQVEEQLNKKICTPELFAQLSRNNTNNLHQLANELAKKLDSATPDY